MARIGITLNEVLRDFLGQFIYTYEKYVEETELNREDIKSTDLIDYFNFNSIDELNKFLYDEAALEIFGHADQMGDNLMDKFNLFLMDIKDEEEHEVEIVSRGAMKSIPSTFFFLSKLSCKIETVRFVVDYTDYWKDTDVLITADPKALEAKPDGKMSIKINAPYNENVKSDFELDSILDFIVDEDLRDKILNTKITTYEEVDE